MISAADYGFHQGRLFGANETVPADHTVLGEAPEGSVAVPNQLLDNEHSAYSAAIESPTVNRNDFHKAFGAARTILTSAGIRGTPNPGDVNVGADFSGNPVYSDAKFANNKNPGVGKGLINTAGIALGAMGTFKDTAEASKFVAVGNQAGDPNYHAKLDRLKASQDANGFVSALGLNSDAQFTGYKLYENWSNLSPAQKSVALAGVGMQSFRFDDGQHFGTKKVTPEIPGVPAMSAAEGLTLASQGINVAPAAGKWNQLSALQETLYNPRTSVDVVHTANSMGLLGQGTDGRSVPIDRNMMAQRQMTPAPHFGIGAATVPAGAGTPQGYTQVANLGENSVVIPTANKGSAVIQAPNVATEAASDIYRRWWVAKPETQQKQNAAAGFPTKPLVGTVVTPDNKTISQTAAAGAPKPVINPKQTQGVAGGSALAAGLDGMAATNPYSLGAVITHASLANTPISKDASDLQHMSYILGVSMNRLVYGNADKSTDERGKSLITDGAWNEAKFNESVKNIRAEYARNGIASKEIGYQLANQGFAEGRFDESQHAALLRSLDMVFDPNSFTLAQKLATGKNKGFEILERRNG